MKRGVLHRCAADRRRDGYANGRCALVDNFNGRSAFDPIEHRSTDLEPRMYRWWL